MKERSPISSEIQNKILLESKEYFTSMGIDDVEEQKVIVNKFMTLGGALINDYLNKK